MTTLSMENLDDLQELADDYFDQLSPRHLVTENLD